MDGSAEIGVGKKKSLRSPGGSMLLDFGLGTMAGHSSFSLSLRQMAPLWSCENNNCQGAIEMTSKHFHHDLAIGQLH